MIDLKQILFHQLLFLVRFLIIIIFFYSGGENGDGEIYVTLRDATFDGSDIFGHCAQLYQIINNKNVQPFIILLQTDGGPDHNLNF